MRWVGVAALSAALSWTAGAQAELVVTISKAQQQVSVVVDGNHIYRWPVSTGRRGFATPAGEFRPTRLERRWYSRKYDLSPMPWSVFFHRGYAIHGTTEIANLGQVASHGCVRLRPDNAATLFSLVRQHGNANTKVMVLNGALPVPPVSPGAVEMVDNEAAPSEEAEQHFAKAFRDVVRSDGTIRPAVRPDDEPHGNPNSKPNTKPQKPRPDRPFEHKFASVDAATLAGREAWLRSLDRKYGITR